MHTHERHYDHISMCTCTVQYRQNSAEFISLAGRTISRFEMTSHYSLILSMLELKCKYKKTDHSNRQGINASRQTSSHSCGLFALESVGLDLLIKN